MSNMSNMTTLQVYRLENTSGEHYKQYTLLGNSNYVFFGFSRIGNAWQWMVPDTGDKMGKLRSQMRSKENGGYDRVWNADVTIPTAWAEHPKLHGTLIQDLVEATFREGKPSGTAGTPVSSERPSPLSDLLDNARSVVSKMAVDPDSALAEYAELLGNVEAAESDLATVTSYMDTLQIMLSTGGTA